MGSPSADDAANALKIHNDARAKKHLAPLKWDDDLSHQATEYARVLAAADKGLKHSGKPGQGENLYAEKGIPDPPASQGAHAWINEGSHYHGEKIGEGDFGSFGHYTQCMWSSTTKVGIGHATAASGWVFVVGRYTPAGNISGQKPY